MAEPVRPALGSSPLGLPPRSGTHALAVLTGPGRRMRALLRFLRGTTHGYAEATLERQFGQHVHELLTPLQLAQHVERDLGGRYRLTASGRSFSRAA
jgi:hypothetical protein